MKSKLFLLISLTIVMGMLMASCAPVVAPAPAAPAEEPAAPAEEPAVAEPQKTLTIGIAEDVSALDPPTDWAIVTTWVVSNMFDCLVWRGRVTHDEFKPILATGWEALDEDTWRFDLREGVTFHNGEPFTAEAVKYSIDRILNDDQIIVHSQWTHITEVRIIDDYTVEIDTAYPVPDMLSKLAGTGCGIVPPKYTEEVGRDEFARNPVGTGPFKFKEWARDEYISMTRNDDYWQGPAAVEELTFRVIPEGATRVAELLTGGVDITDPVEVQDWPRVEADENLELIKADTTRTMLIVHRCDEPFVTANVKIREAIDYAIDDGALMDLIGGMGTPVLSRITPPTMSWSEEYFDKYNFDAEKAKALMAEAGYDGEPVTLHSTTSWFMQKEVSEAVGAMLMDVGFNIDLQIMEPSTFREQVYYPEKANQEIMILALGNSFFDPWIAMKGFYSKQSRVRAMWFNDEFDALWEKALVEMDPAAREQYFLDMQALVVAERPYNTLYFMKSAYGKKTSLNWQVPPDGFYWMHNASFE